jgi:hypothetical protein
VLFMGWRGWHKPWAPVFSRPSWERTAIFPSLLNTCEGNKKSEAVETGVQRETELIVVVPSHHDSYLFISATGARQSFSGCPPMRRLGLSFSRQGTAPWLTVVFGLHGELQRGRHDSSVANWRRHSLGSSPLMVHKEALEPASVGRCLGNGLSLIGPPSRALASAS